MATLPVDTGPDKPNSQLPPLRQELRIERGAPLVTGAPSWTLFDPVRHLFYQLGQVEFQIFSHWNKDGLEGVRSSLIDDGMTGDQAEQAIGRVLEFSYANSLTLAPATDVVQSLAQQKAATKRDWWRWMIDHYLFIRIPLVHPARFLARTVDKVAPLWSPVTLSFFAILGLTGLFLVSRQWDAFMASFLYFFSLQGFLAYSLALGVVKVAHEMGHAYTATRFGCRVPAMGVSFLVMMPVLYTDTSAAWKLTSRRKRLLIDCAGVTVELMIASIATMFWVFLPDGSLRSVAFVLGTTSWVTSLFINLNPFMRFDGYYLMSDAIGVPNLQARSFALARWHLREKFFALHEAPPEQVPARLQFILILYAWKTWIYRLVLYFGIALLVYHMFFKALGIILFVVEMVVFIFRPFMSEFKQWYLRRDAIKASPRHKIWLWAGLVLALLIILPIDRHVDAPALLKPIGDVPVVSGDPARIDRILVRNGQHVEKNTIIAVLSAPEIERDAADRSLNIARIVAQIARTAADVQDLSNRTVLERELMTEQAALEGLNQRRARLVLRAPVSGVVVDIGSDMHAGRWLGGSETVARIVTPGRYDVQAYIDEDDVWRLSPDALARFVPDDVVEPSRRAKLIELSASATTALDEPILASTNGGAIAVAKDDHGALKPRNALYRARLVAALDSEQPNFSVQPTPGRVIISASGESLLAKLFRGIARVTAQESSLTG